MFKVTYYEISSEGIDEVVDVMMFLYLLELYKANKYVKNLSATFEGKHIDCLKLISSLKF